MFVLIPLINKHNEQGIQISIIKLIFQTEDKLMYVFIFTITIQFVSWTVGALYARRMSRSIN